MKKVGEDFAGHALPFCEFVERAGELPLAVRMQTAQRLLLALYTAALELPEVAGDDGPDQDSLLRAQAHFDHLDFYWEIFDPYGDDEPVAGDLADDLGDIYRDLQNGFAYWNSGRPEAAVWQWRFLFHAHWGDHAADAIRALHWAQKQPKREARAQNARKKPSRKTSGVKSRSPSGRRT